LNAGSSASAESPSHQEELVLTQTLAPVRHHGRRLANMIRPGAGGQVGGRLAAGARTGLRVRASALLAGAAVVLSACAAGGSPAVPSPTAGGSTAASPAGGSSAGPSGAAAASGPATKLVVGLGYIPSVQFAQFYLAQEAGYYRDAGLEVTLENKIDPDLVTLIGQGAIDIGLSDGTSVIPAVSQGIPIVYAATIYGSNPSIVFAKESSGIHTAADLKGRKLGIPGKYGSSWIMLQALLRSVGLTPSDLQLVLYPDYGQGVAVQQGAVDAATGFTNNEPVQLQLAGEKVVVLHGDQATPLPGPGLVTSTATLASKAATSSGLVHSVQMEMTYSAGDLTIQISRRS